MESRTAQVIRRRLASAHLREAQLAQRLGISKAYLSGILSGHRVGKRVAPHIEAALDALLAERTTGDVTEAS